MLRIWKPNNTLTSCDSPEARANPPPERGPRGGREPLAQCDSQSGTPKLVEGRFQPLHALSRPVPGIFNLLPARRRTFAVGDWRRIAGVRGLGSAGLLKFSR